MKLKTNHLLAIVLLIVGIMLIGCGPAGNDTETQTQNSETQNSEIQNSQTQNNETEKESQMNTMDTEIGLNTELDSTTESETTTELEPATESESVTESETSSESEGVTESQTTTEPEGSKESQTPTPTESEATSEPDTSKSEQSPTEPEEPTIIETDFGVANPSGKLTTIGGRVSSHDPSVEYDPVTKKWYIFGSHTAFASSSDLINWTSFEYEGTSNAKYGTVFAKSGEWAARGGGNYNIEGNLWAPDVIYNEDMGKWCMYMSVNGNNFYSSIALATADSITGPYTYQGTVVYSGFSNTADVSLTDYQKVTGTTNVSRYTSGGWGYYGTNAIDPCVLYDKDGELWMVYGSWFGGIFMLKLDNETGLRDYSYTYPLDTNATDGVASDPYLGIRVSGGYGGTGEGAYIVWDKTSGYYYMYVSYCGLNATDGFSGYQMRLFRSKNITGPYTDASGNYAIRRYDGDDQSVKGIKIMGNYNFSSLATAPSTTGCQNGYRSPGHNSALVDNEGNYYLIYHTRFNKDTEWHQVRVHQQFMNEDGWLVTAPYEYLGSKISKTGYAESEIVGSYELINHGNEITFDVVAPMLSTYAINLNADHTITGDFEGTWSQKSGTYYATIIIDGATYKGVFFKQYDESSSHKETMTFSVIGSNNIALWGSRIGDVTAPETGKQIAAYKFENAASLGKDTIGTIGTASVYGCTFYTDSVRGNVLAFDGKNDYVQLSSKATEYDSYTIMMWYKSTSSSLWQRIFDLGDNSASSMFLTAYAYDAGIRFAQQINGDGEKQVNGSTTALNTWTHVAVTVNGKSNNATLYINGSRVGTVTLSALPEDYAGTANYLGKSQYDDPYFAGYMDDVYIFDYALSANEVKSYMNK